MGLFAGRGFSLDDAQWSMAFVEHRARDEDLAGGAATEVEAFAVGNRILHQPVVLEGWVDIEEAWTVGGGSSTALGLEVGDSGDPNGVNTTSDLVLLSAGLTKLGGDGAQALRGNAPVQTGYDPELLFTASGGTPDAGHADAGDLRCRIYHACIPESFYEYNLG